MTKETKLGLFVIVAAGFFAIAIMLLGDITIERGYQIYILFSDIAGLPSKAQVRIAGVNIGKVRAVTLEGDKAKLRVWIKRQVKLHKDTQAKIIATGIIGSKYLELSPGSPEEPLLKSGDIIRGVDPISMDKMLTSALESIQSLTDSFKVEDGRNLGEQLTSIAANLNDITSTLRKAIALQEQKVIDIVSNVNSLTQKTDRLVGNLDDIIADGKTDLKKTISSIKNISEKLDDIISTINAGEGVAGKLLKDKEMGDELKQSVSDLQETTKEARRIVKRLTAIDTHWDATLRYDIKHNLYRPDVGIRVSPTKDKYYYFGGRNLGRKRDVYDPEARNNIDFHVARTKPYGSIYAGIIKSAGGIGITARPFWKSPVLGKFEIKLEGHDFFRKTPVGAPKFDIGGKINVFKFVNVGANVEDIAHENNSHVYFNLFMKDEDIGYLLGLVGLARP